MQSVKDSDVFLFFYVSYMLNNVCKQVYNINLVKACTKWSRYSKWTDYAVFCIL